MAIRVHRALEPVRHVIHMREAGHLHRLCRGQAAHAAAAQEVDVMLRREAGLLKFADEIAVFPHRRKHLPRHQHGLLAGRGQVGNTDIGPFHIRAHIDQLRLRIGLQTVPGLCGGDILDHSRNSG